MGGASLQGITRFHKVTLRGTVPLIPRGCTAVAGAFQCRAGWFFYRPLVVLVSLLPEASIQLKPQGEPRYLSDHKPCGNRGHHCII
mgnify:CR=1 FL=1